MVLEDLCAASAQGGTDKWRAISLRYFKYAAPVVSLLDYLTVSQSCWRSSLGPDRRRPVRSTW
jgi:hypothetical protein